MIIFVEIGFLFLASCLCTGLFLTYYLVPKQSHALKALAQLNFVYKPWIPNVKPFLQTIPTTVDSKAKFDWFNFEPLADDYILNHRQELIQFIDFVKKVHQQFSEYCSSYNYIWNTSLGYTISGTMPQNWFNYIEHKLFQNNKLGQPNPSMKIKFVVTYTSPMGRNSYSRCRALSGVDEIGQYIVNMNQRIQKKSTEAFQRELERSKMSRDVRYRVLARDGKRCRSCGRSSDVVTLHVDHIRPISKGGRTELNNLQTLCADCNLGKSNKW